MYGGGRGGGGGGPTLKVSDSKTKLLGEKFGMPQL